MVSTRRGNKLLVMDKTLGLRTLGKHDKALKYGERRHQIRSREKDEQKNKHGALVVGAS